MSSSSSFPFVLFVALVAVVSASTGLVRAQDPTTTAAPTGNASAFVYIYSKLVDYEDKTIPSKIDLIFDFFTEDTASINSYTVTIAQMLKVPTRRVDFYNLQQGEIVPLNQRRLSNTPYGAKTMVRVTIQPALKSETKAPTAPVVRDKLLSAAKAKDPALAAIFIDDANPIDIGEDQIFTYSGRTVFDLMYMFVMATMAVAYLAFICFVIFKMFKQHKLSKLEMANREREREERKNKAKAKARARGGAEAEDEIGDDESDVAIDASKWDDAGDDPGADDDARDEDGLAVRTIVDDMTNKIRGSPENERQVSFNTGSPRRGAPSKNQRLLAELDNMILPPSGGMTRGPEKDVDDL